jgi:hypothetical protein
MEREGQFIFSGSILAGIVRYLYLDELPAIDGTTAVEYLHAAEYFSIPALKEASETVIKSLITVENVAEMFDQAEMSSSPSLMDLCERYLLSTGEFVLNHPSFETLPQGSVQSLLKRKSLQVQEITVFRALARWCQANSRTMSEFWNLLRIDCLLKPEWKLEVLSCPFVDADMKFLLRETGFDPKRAATSSRCTQKVATAEGILQDVSLDTLIADGWIVAYCEPFSHVTPKHVIENSCRGNMIGLGYRKASDKNVLCLVAFAPKLQLFSTETAARADRATALHGAYWYHVSGQCMGFSDSPQIKLRKADMMDGNMRMSIHVDGLYAGYRAGAEKNLQEREDLEKVILWKSQ